MRNLLLSALSLLLFLVTNNGCSGCSEHCYEYNNYATLSDYKTAGKKEEYTNTGVKVYLNGQQATLENIDTKVVELEKCLGISAKRKCFAIYIAENWYNSHCSNEQLLPIAAPHEQCEAKGLFLPPKCWGLDRPTSECPCVCNYRVSLQYNYLIVVTPNLKLLKAELARLITGVNNPWADEDIRRCL